MTIRLPTIPKDQPDLPFSLDNGTQTVMQLYQTLQNIAIEEGALASELAAPFTLHILTNNRVLLTAADGENYSCYMSDVTADARLVVDDYSGVTNP